MSKNVKPTAQTVETTAPIVAPAETAIAIIKPTKTITVKVDYAAAAKALADQPGQASLALELGNHLALSNKAIVNLANTDMVKARIHLGISVKVFNRVKADGQPEYLDGELIPVKADKDGYILVSLADGRQIQKPASLVYDTTEKSVFGREVGIGYRNRQKLASLIAAQAVLSGEAVE